MYKKFIINTSLSAIVLMIIIIPFVSFGQDKLPGGDKIPGNGGGQTTSNSTNSKVGRIDNPLRDQTSIPAFISSVLKGVAAIATPIVVLAIIYSGLLFVFARGKSEQLTKAKMALLYSLIGAALILGAVAIADLVVSTIGGVIPK